MSDGRSDQLTGMMARDIVKSNTPPPLQAKSIHSKESITPFLLSCGTYTWEGRNRCKMRFRAGAHTIKTRSRTAATKGTKRTAGKWLNKSVIGETSTTVDIMKPVNASNAVSAAVAATATAAGTLRSWYRSERLAKNQTTDPGILRGRQDRLYNLRLVRNLIRTPIA